MARPRVRPEPLDDVGVSILPVPRQRVAIARVQHDLVLFLVLLEQRGELQGLLDRHPRIAAAVEQQDRYVDLAGPVDRGAAREVLRLATLEIGPHPAPAGPAHAAEHGIVSRDELRAPRLHAEIGHAGYHGRGVHRNLPTDGDICHRPAARHADHEEVGHVDVPEVARQGHQIHDVVDVTAAPLVDALAPAAAAVVGREHDEPFLRPEVEGDELLRLDRAKVGRPAAIEDDRRQLPSGGVLRLVDEADDAQAAAAVGDSQALEVTLVPGFVVLGLRKAELRQVIELRVRLVRAASRSAAGARRANSSVIR
jgi:hypothetical protein